MQFAYDIVKIGILLFAFAALVDGFSEKKTGLLSKAGAYFGWSLTLGMVAGLLASLGEGRLGLPGIWSWIVPMVVALGLAFALDGKPINRFITFFGVAILIIGSLVGLVGRAISLRIDAPLLLTGGMIAISAVTAIIVAKRRPEWLLPAAAVLCCHSLLNAIESWLRPFPSRVDERAIMDQYLQTSALVGVIVLAIAIGVAVYMARRTPKTSSPT